MGADNMAMGYRGRPGAQQLGSAQTTEDGIGMENKIAALTKMQPHSATLGIIAREMALVTGSASYSPDDAQHMPGITN